MNLEQQIIGAILLSPKAYDEAGYRLSEADFGDRHTSIFRAIRTLANEGKAIDAVTVCDWLDANGLLRDGGKYISEIASNTVSAANISEYVERQIDYRLSKTVDQIVAEMRGTKGSGAERLAHLQSLLTGIEDAVHNEPQRIDYGKWFEVMQSRSDGVTGLATGFCDVDKRLGGLRGDELIILAGRPSMGKSALALQILRHISAQSVGLMFNLEMSQLSLADRLVSSVSGIEMGNMRSARIDAWERVTDATQKLNSLNLYVDDQPALTIQEIWSRSRQIKRRHGLGLIVVDYLQLIGTTTRHQVREQQIAEISRTLKAIAKDLHVPVIALSQLNRDLEKRPDKRPIMADLRESGAIEQDADAIGFLYREEVYDQKTERKGICELLWRKVRNGEQGTDYLRFVGATQQFQQVDRTTLPAKVEQWGAGPYAKEKRA